MSIFAPAIEKDGAIAQLVEQRTENPCVPGSIPGGTTIDKKQLRISWLLFSFLNVRFSWFYSSCVNRGVNQKCYDNNNQRTMLQV